MKAQIDFWLLYVNPFFNHIQQAMENAEANEAKRKELEENLTSITVEKEKLFNELRQENERLMETEERLMAEQNEKEKLLFR